MALPSLNLASFNIKEKTPPQKEGFLKTAAAKVGEFGKALGEAPKAFLPSAPSPEGVRPGDIIREIPGAAKEIGEDIAQSIARSFFAISQTGFETLKKLTTAEGLKEVAKKVVKPDALITTPLGPAKKALDILELDAQFVPQTELQKKLVGGEKPVSFESIGREMADIIGKGESISKPSAIGLGLVVAGLDILPGGDDVIKTSARQIAKLKNADEIVKVLKNIIKGDEHRIKSLAEGLVHVDDPIAAEDVIKKIKENPNKFLPELPKIPQLKLDLKIDPINELKKTFQEFKPMAIGEFVKNPEQTIRLAELPTDIVKKLNFQESRAVVSRRTVKHIMERRGEEAQDILKKLPEVLSNPTKIADNTTKRPNSYLFAKKNGDIYSTVLEVLKKPDGNQVVNARRMHLDEYDKLVDISGRTALPVKEVGPSIVPSPKGRLAAGRLEARPQFPALQKVSKSTIPQPKEAVKPLKPAVPTPKEYVAAKQAKQAAFRELKGKEAIRLEAEAERRAYERAGIKPEIVQGIKNNPHYLKEGEIKDAMGEGYLMVKNKYEMDKDTKALKIVGKRYAVVEKKDVARFRELGYERGSEIDSLASEAGYESGYEYLKDQLRRSKVSRAITPEGVAREEFKKDVFGQEYQRQMDLLKGKVDLQEYYALGKEVLERERGNSRRARIRAVRDYFGLSDDDLHTISRKDPRYMGEAEFVKFLDDIGAKAVKLQKTRQAKNELIDLIKTREFKKTENLQQAMKLPPIEKMTEDQIRQFHEALLPFQHGDEFLSVRKLETIDKTDMVGIKTIREARQRLAKDLGVEMMLTDPELRAFEPSSTSRFRYDSPLARQNKYFGWLVDQHNKGILQAEYDFIKFKRELESLVKKARGSRKRGIAERAIPTDRLVFKFMETADPAERMKIQGLLTKEELDLAGFLQAKFAEARDYLAQNYAMTNFKEHYITHVRRRFLEALKTEYGEVRQAGKFVGEQHRPIGRLEAFGKGLKKAFGEILDSYKQDEEVFKILEGDTGEILPLEKFFAYSLHRAGRIPPTENVAKAAETYFRTFYKKQQLDALIPKVETFNYLLTPTAKTPRGLEKDRTITKFVRQWINTKKGRVIDLSGLLRQGGPVDLVLRGGKVITSLIDLGLNIPVQFGAQFGEQVMNIKAMGFRNYTLGARRLASEQGRKIVKEYENFVGRSVWELLTDVSKNIGDKLNEAFFAGFRNSSRQANKIFLLGEMTAKEFAEGKISAERLGELRTLLGRHRVMPGADSVFGATSLGKTWSQYKEWAFVPLQTSMQNWAEIGKKIVGLKGAELIKSRAFQEELRGAIIAAAVGLIGYGLVNTKEKDESFIGKVIQKSWQDAMSTLAVVDPTRLASQARLEKFVLDIATAIKQIVLMERYKTEEGLKGVETLKRTITPRVLKRPAETKKEDGGQFEMEGVFKVKNFETKLPSLRLSDF